MGVAAHPHRDQLEQRRAVTGPRPLGRPRERHRNLVGVGAVDRDPGNPVTLRLVGEHPHRGLFGHRRRQRRLVVLQTEHGGQPPRGAQVDRFVPLAERRTALADEGHHHPAGPGARERQRHARQGQRARGERRRRRQDPEREVADVQILAVHRRPGLPHLRRQHHPNRLGRGTHRQHHAEVADDRRHDVPVPVPAGAKIGTPPQPDRGRVNGLLPQRSESLALKRGVAEPDFAAGEQGFQAVVGGARQDHAAQDLAALAGGERGPDRGPAQEAIARRDDFRDGGREARLGRHTGSGLAQPARRQRIQPVREGGRKRPAQIVEIGGAPCARRSDPIEGIPDRRPRERKSFGDELAEAGERRGRDRFRHGQSAAHRERSRAVRPRIVGRNAGARRQQGGPIATPSSPSSGRRGDRLPHELLDLGRRPRARWSVPLPSRPRTPPSSESSGCGTVRRAPARRPCSP